MLIMKTNMGDISLELDFENAPKTAENFLNYAKKGFYDGTIFHRVIGNFMIQGGGFDKDMRQKAVEAPVANEGKKGMSNKKGSLAMARTSDPHSATAQFFINVVDNDFLNFSSETTNGWGYCVFGKVVDGMDVVEKIKKVSTADRAGHQNVPVEVVMIEKMEVVEDK